MAARMIGRAKSVFLQPPQKSPSINPLHRFLRNVVGLGVPSTKTRLFSTNSESNRRSSWLTERRRLLGIQDDDLVLAQHPRACWRPPRDGEIKINFCVVLSGVRRDDTGAVTAVARDSYGVLLGVTAGIKDFGDKSWGIIELYALKASANLAKELRSTGMHHGRVVYESPSLALVTACTDETSPDVTIYEDLEEVCRRAFPIFCGAEDTLREMLPDDLHSLFDLVERDRRHAGKHHARFAIAAEDPGSHPERGLEDLEFDDRHRRWKLLKEYWDAFYETEARRRRMRIHDGDLVLVQHARACWRPPGDGEIKINFCYVLSGLGRDVTGAITAIARNSSGDILGVTAGFKNFGNQCPDVIEMYALKVAANLAEELRRRRMHDGRVVFECPSPARVTSDFFVWGRMPSYADLEEFGRSFRIFCGADEMLRGMFPGDLHLLLVLAERDKRYAGLETYYTKEVTVEGTDLVDDDLYYTETPDTE